MSQTGKLQAIRAKCVALLVIGENRTNDGEWYKVEHHPDNGLIWLSKHTCSNMTEQDAVFIAACAGSAEAGWRSTIVAIDGLSCGLAWWDIPRADQIKLEKIITAWEGLV